MRFVDEFRDVERARGLARAIHAEALPDRRYRLMEFCGGHTHAIARHGLSDLLPQQVRLVHGPGCPVCVLPIGRVDMAITLALEGGVTLCTYADTLRIPASQGMTLLKAKSAGADVRAVYSPADALAIARADTSREVVFMAIGFETTTPPTALAIDQACSEGLGNFSVMCNHVLTPPAIMAILEGAASGQGASLDGIVGPGHVSLITGAQAFAPVVSRHGMPLVIAGFEPLDVLQAILLLLRQINDGRAALENQFTRAVTLEGNRKAQARIERVFQRRESFEWRGLGTLANSALRLADRYAPWDAERKFCMHYRTVADHKACACSEVLRGIRDPRECKIFGTVCTPDHPIGSCMVSSEGACAAVYLHRSKPRAEPHREPHVKPQPKPRAEPHPEPHPEPDAKAPSQNGAPAPEPFQAKDAPCGDAFLPARTGLRDPIIPANPPLSGRDEAIRTTA
ncbi:MAG: hydrogenase formation protein HypD [Betaproteobacteria bacterium]